MRHDLPEGSWQKSSYSGDNGGGNCIETQRAEGKVAVRDSKNPSQGAHMFSPEAWAAFVASVNAGDFPTV